MTDQTIKLPQRTVRAPAKFMEVFSNAETVVSRYFSARKDDPEHGTIEILGERYLMIRADSLSIDFFKQVDQLFGQGRQSEADQFARNFLFDLGHALGKFDASAFHKKMKLVDPIAKLSAGPVHFAHSGWANVEILPESNPVPNEEYYLVYDHPYSFEAESWLRAGKKGELPVCVMNAGYSSGWCEESYGIHLVSSEIFCRAKGDEKCRFIMAPPSRIEDRILNYLGTAPVNRAQEVKYEIPDFFSRKKIEDALRNSEKRYRRLFETMTEGVALNEIVFSDTGKACGLRFIEVNPAFERDLGLKAAEIIGKMTLEIFPSMNLTGRVLKEILSGHPLRLEGSFGRLGKWFEVCAYLAESNRIALVFFDITERNSIVDCMKEREEELKVLFSILPVGISIIDKNRKILKANPALEKIIGMTAEDLRQEKYKSITFLKSDGSPMPNKELPTSRVLREKKPVSNAIVGIPRSGGKFTWTEVSAVPLPDGNIAAVTSDITEQRKSEEDRFLLHQEHVARVEAEKGIRLRDEFISIASHELKTPLTALKMQIQIIPKALKTVEFPEKERLIGLLQSSMRQLDQFSRLVEELLDVSRIGAGRLFLDPQEVDLSSVITRVIENHRTDLCSSKCDVATKLDRSIIGLWDPTRIEQVIVNLLTNAMKYGAGNSIDISTELACEKAKLVVRDHGIGISREDQAKIFERFERAASITKYGGLGLGLYISRQLVQAHGGTIHVESELGKGSTFIVELPLKSNPVQ